MGKAEYLGWITREAAVAAMSAKGKCSARWEILLPAALALIYPCPKLKLKWVRRKGDSPSSPSPKIQKIQRDLKTKSPAEPNPKFSRKLHAFLDTLAPCKNLDFSLACVWLQGHSQTNSALQVFPVAYLGR